MKTRLTSALYAKLPGPADSPAGYLSSTKETIRTLLRKIDVKYSTVIQFAWDYCLPVGFMVTATVYGTVKMINNEKKPGARFSPSLLPTKNEAYLLGLGLSISAIFAPLFAGKLKSYYYRFLSAPVGAILNVPVSQTNLAYQIAWRRGNLERLKGACAGVTHVWGRYRLEGKDLIAELNSFRINPLLLDEIDAQQQKTSAIIIDKAWPAPFHPECEEQFITVIDTVTTSIVAEASNNPGRLFGLTFSQQNEGHIVGVMASNGPDQDAIWIKYFDTNYREATFKDEESASKSLGLLLRYGYGSFFQVKKPVSLTKIRQELPEGMTPEEKANKMAEICKDMPLIIKRAL